MNVNFKTNEKRKHEKMNEHLNPKIEFEYWKSKNYIRILERNANIRIQKLHSNIGKECEYSNVCSNP